MSETVRKLWILYILRCADGTFYTGITNDLERRIEAHDTGKGAKYTRGRGPVQILYTEQFVDRADASRRERIVKSLSRTEKEKLILSVQTARTTRSSRRSSK